MLRNRTTVISHATRKRTRRCERRKDSAPQETQTGHPNQHIKKSRSRRLVYILAISPREQVGDCPESHGRYQGQADDSGSYTYHSLAVHVDDIFAVKEKARMGDQLGTRIEPDGSRQEPWRVALTFQVLVRERGYSEKVDLSPSTRTACWCVYSPANPSLTRQSGTRHSVPRGRDTSGFHRTRYWGR